MARSERAAGLIPFIVMLVLFRRIAAVAKVGDCRHAGPSSRLTARPQLRMTPLPD